MYKKSTLLICFILVVFVGLNNQYFSQSNSFSEKLNEDISREFNKIDQYAKPTQELHLSNIDRSIGFEINNTILNGSALTRELHYSGEVIFSSEAVTYLNHLKNDLLKDFPFLKDKIKVYVTKSSSFNAFATVNNNIYINIGLLAVIENEYQLCFILCHEIMHIVNDHIINQQLQESGLVKHKYDQYDIVDKLKIKITDKHSISRSHEYEADLDGFRLFLHNGLPSAEAKNALSLLKKNGGIGSEVIMTPDLIFINDSLFNKIRNSKGDYSKKTSGDDGAIVDFSTHPSIDRRLEYLSDFLNESPVNQYEKKLQGNSFVFERIKNDAMSLLPQLYAIEGDYITLFLYSSQGLHKGDTSEKRIGDLCYSLQGIFFQKFDSGFGFPNDSLKLFFVNVLNDIDRIQFCKWVNDILYQLKLKYPTSQKIIKYQNVLSLNILLITTEEERNFLDAKYTDGSFKITILKSLKNISFEIPAGGTTLSLRQQIKFNECYNAKKINSKMAVSNIFTLSVRRGEYLRPLQYLEKLDLQINSSFQKLENNYPDDIISFIPNSNKYFSNDYVNYQLLNNWLVERFYFDNANYVSYFQDNIDSIINGGVKYALTGINLEVRQMNNRLFEAAFFGIILFPHYIPQSILKVCLRKKRKFMFTIAFDLENGEVVFWDKRTFLEANSVAQWYQNYNNIVTKIRKK